MKRRLSVAMAMIGRPTVALLDEPTTGLDPASKQDLWEVINRAKKNCAILLTTHSMEEAEALCDRLGIFVQGRLATLSTAEQLKSRYGTGYRLVISSDTTTVTDINNFIIKLSPLATRLNVLGGTQQFEIPFGAVELSRLFRKIEAEKDSLKILDWGVANTSLEEIFHLIADAVENDTFFNLIQNHSTDSVTASS
jgi:ABC-type multidrug transport system ATPase subunit